MSVIRLVLLLAVAGVACVNAALRFEIGRSFQYKYEIESAAALSQDILRSTYVSRLTDLPANFGMSSAYLAPYYQWEAAVRVTPRCRLTKVGQYRSEVRLVDVEKNKPICSAGHQSQCDDALRHQRIIAQYPITITQALTGEIVRIEVDPRIARDVSRSEAELLKQMCRSLVRPLSTLVPTAEHNETVIPTSDYFMRIDPMTGHLARYGYRLHADDNSWLLVAKHSEFPETTSGNKQSKDIKEKANQFENTQVIVEGGLVSRVMNLVGLTVSTQYKAQPEWKEATTVLTRSSMMLMDDVAAVAEEGGRWSVDESEECTEAAGEEDLVLMQMPTEHERSESSESIEDEAAAEAEFEAEGDTPISHGTNRKGRKSAANVWGVLSAASEADILADESAEDGDTPRFASQTAYAANDVSEAALAARAAARVGAPQTQDVVTMLQRAEVAFRALDGLTEQILAVQIVNAEVRTYAEQIQRVMATDSTACSIQWSKLFVAVSSKATATSSGGSSSDMMSGPKLSQSGLLYLLSTSTGPVEPIAASNGATEQYPSEVNLNNMIDTIVRPINAMLDDSEYSADAKQLLRMDDPASPFSKFRKLLSTIDELLVQAKRAVNAANTGVNPSYDAIAKKWKANINDDGGRGLPPLTASSSCDPAANNIKRITTVVKMMSGPIIAQFDVALKQVGQALSKARSLSTKKAIDDSIPGGMKGIMTQLGVFSSRIEKGFGDPSMIKATIYAEVGSRINQKEQSATVSVSSGLYGEALGRRGSILELSYTPTFTQVTRESGKRMFEDADIGVSIMGMKLKPSNLSPSHWLSKIAPDVAKRLVDTMADTEPVFKQMVQVFATLIRDPNLFGGAFFRPPIIKPAQVAAPAAVPKSFLEVVSSTDSDAETATERTDAESESDAEAELAVDANAALYTSEGLLTESGTRLRATVQHIPEDPLHAMFFRAVKSIVTHTNEAGVLVAVNEKSLPSAVHTILHISFLMESLQAECAKDTGLAQQAEHFAAVIDYLKQLGGNLVRQLWAGVANWQPVSTDPLIDRQIQSRFGGAVTELKKGAAAAAASRLSSALTALGRIGEAPPAASAQPQRRSQRSRDAAPTYFPPPTPANPIGPFVGTVKNNAALRTQINAMLEHASTIHDGIFAVLTQAGDLVAVNKRASYIATWKSLSDTFKAAQTNFNAMLPTFRDRTMPGSVRAYAGYYGEQAASAERLSQFTESIRAVLQTIFVDLRAASMNAMGASNQFFNDVSLSTSNTAMELWSGVEKQIDEIEPKVLALYTTYLAESHAGGISKTDTTKPEFRLNGLLDTLRRSVRLTSETVFVTRYMNDVAAAFRRSNANGSQLKSGMRHLSGNVLPGWRKASNAVLDAADVIDFRPNRWLSSIGTASDAFSSMIGILDGLSALDPSNIVSAAFKSVEPTTNFNLQIGPTEQLPSQITCSGPRSRAAWSAGRKTIFSRDWQLLSVQLGPFPLGPISVVVGLGLTIHSHLDMEYAMCEADFPNRNDLAAIQRTNQIAIVTDLTAKVIGDVSVGVGVPFLSMGVQVAVTFLDVHLPVHSVIDTQMLGQSLWAKPYLEALAGEVKMYIDVFVRFATTVYKWGGTRTYLPNSDLCTQSRADMAICPPTSAWDKRAKVHSSGAIASPPARPVNTGKCIPCNYKSTYWTTPGSWWCPLIPKRFAAVAGYAGAQTLGPAALIDQIDLRHDKIEFMSVCQESFKPLTLDEYSARSTRAVYTGTFCLRQHVDVKRPKLRVFRVAAGVSTRKEAFTSAEIFNENDPSYKFCLEFEAKHDSFTNGILPTEGSSTYRADDSNYIPRIFNVAPRFQLKTTDAANTLASVPYLALTGPKDGADFTTPVDMVNKDGKRTGQCFRCRNTIRGAANEVYECPLSGRRYALMQATAARYGYRNVQDFARKSMAALAEAKSSARNGRPLPTTEQHVFVCDEYLPTDTTYYFGGFLFVRDSNVPSSLSHFMGDRYECSVNSKGVHKCAVYPGLRTIAYDTAVNQLAEKTFEYNERILKKFEPCRPAPVRVHRPSDKLKANGGCVWCSGYSSSIECGERINTDREGNAGEIRGRRFGPLEGIPPAEFERFSDRVNKFAYVAYRKVAATKSRWPAQNSDEVKHIALCDEQVILDSASGGKPTVTFDVSTKYNGASTTEYKTEYVFSVSAASSVAGKSKSWVTEPKTWPALMRLDTELRHRYSSIDFPDFPSDGDPFLKLFGGAGGEPTAKLAAERAAQMKKYFDAIVNYQSVWNDYMFGSFFSFDTKLPSDGTVYATYLCVNVENSLADCVKISTQLSTVVSRYDFTPSSVDITYNLESSNQKADQTISYFFSKMVMDAYVSMEAKTANKPCDALPPGMANDPNSGVDTSQYVD